VLLGAERALVVRYARQFGEDGLVVGTAGNLSVRAGDVVAITPSALAYEALTPEAIEVVSLEGQPRESGPAPSTELPMHLAVYEATGAAAIVHLHPPYATAVAAVVDELPPIHYLVAELGGPVRVVPYATPGSAELAASVAAALEGRSAVLLRSHGALTFGDSLEQAYGRSLLLEWLCALLVRARAIGEPALLPEGELARLADAMERYRSPG
jgi:L-fuculose-phosphate aldolase